MILVLNVLAKKFISTEEAEFEEAYIFIEILVYDLFSGGYAFLSTLLVDNLLV